MMASCCCLEFEIDFAVHPPSGCAPLYHFFGFILNALLKLCPNSASTPEDIV